MDSHGVVSIRRANAESFGLHIPETTPLSFSTNFVTAPGKPVNFVDGRPDFTPWAKMSINFPVGVLTGNDTKDKGLARNALDAANNPDVQAAIPGRERLDSTPRERHLSSAPAEPPAAAHRRSVRYTIPREGGMEAAAVTTISLLMPFIDCQYGAEEPDPAQRLQRLREIAPGPVPDDYAATLLELRRTTLLIENSIETIEPPTPPAPGTREWVGEHPSIDLLFGLQEGRDNVIDQWQALEFRMPAGLIPIGRDLGNGIICLDLSEQRHGQIVHWFGLGDPGPDVDGRPGRGNTFLLAHSFTDLCRRLRPPPPDDVVDNFDPSTAKICSVRR